MNNSYTEGKSQFHLGSITIFQYKGSLQHCSNNMVTGNVKKNLIGPDRQI